MTKSLHVVYMVKYKCSFIVIFTITDKNIVHWRIKNNYNFV